MDTPILPPRPIVHLALGLRRFFLKLADAVVPAPLAMIEKSMGLAFTAAIGLAAKHKLADLVQAGPKSSGELAALTGLRPDALERVLRALCTIGVFTREPDGRFATTRVGTGLRSDVPGSARAMAQYLGTPSNMAAWADFEETVKSGLGAFERVHDLGVWDYFDQHPEERDTFAEAMVRVTELLGPAVARAYPWNEVRSVCDVGGGRGHLLASILREHPALNGVLFDGAGVAELARTHLREAGLESRVRIESGSFFEKVPPGAEAYLLKDILHDWDDVRCRQILGHVRAVAQPGTRLLIVEMRVEATTTSGPGPFSDLQMMTVCGEGRQRSKRELTALFDACGFELRRIFPTALLFDVVEGVAR